LEAARRGKLIGSSLEAKVVLSATGAALEWLRKHQSELATLFIVSQVEVVSSPSPRAQTISLPSSLGGSANAEVLPADGQKCPRCWTYAPEVGRSSDVCAKCVEAGRMNGGAADSLAVQAWMDGF